MRHSKNIQVKFTSAHVLFKVRLQHDQMKLKGKKPNASIVPAMYFGDESYGSASTNYMVQTA